MRLSLIVILVALALSSLGTAQAPVASSGGWDRTQVSGSGSAITVAQAQAPVLTDIQQLTLQNHLYAIEVAQLKAQAAQREFERAAQAAQQLLNTLQVKGYVLNLQKTPFVYEPSKPSEEVK